MPLFKFSLEEAGRKITDSIDIEGVFNPTIEFCEQAHAASLTISSQFMNAVHMRDK
jgi:hypothetical protein